MLCHQLRTNESSDRVRSSCSSGKSSKPVNWNSESLEILHAELKAISAALAHEKVANDLLLESQEILESELIFTKGNLTEANTKVDVLTSEIEKLKVQSTMVKEIGEQTSLQTELEAAVAAEKVANDLSTGDSESLEILHAELKAISAALAHEKVANDLLLESQEILESELRSTKI